jgi:hypothetical protein
MKIMFVDEDKCGVNIIAEEHWVTVTLTELSGNFLKSKYDVFATKLYQDRLKGKVDPLNIVWIGHLPREGRFEVQMPWHKDREGYGRPFWHKISR